jgi:hypothetical protein
MCGLIIIISALDFMRSNEKKEEITTEPFGE